MKFNFKLLMIIVPAVLVTTVFGLAFASNKVDFSYLNEQKGMGGLNTAIANNEDNSGAGKTVIGATAANNGANGNSDYIGTTGDATVGPIGQTIVGPGNTNTGGNNTENPPAPEGGTPVQKQDITGISFEDAEFDSDGLAHSIYISGTLPDGVTVSYSGNGETEQGVYTVTATFNMTHAAALIYNPLSNLTATYTIGIASTVNNSIFEFKLNNNKTGYSLTSWLDRSNTDVVVPDNMNGLPVVAIDDNVFYESALTSISLPSSLLTIGNSSFIRCASLTSVIIPEGVKSIGLNAFSNCDSLYSISIPNSLTSIGTNLFKTTNSIYNVSRSYSSYDNGLYIGNSENPYLYLARAKTIDISSCEINPNCKFIGSSAFSSCTNLTSIKIPEGVVFLDQGPFVSCSNLTSVILPSTIKFVNYQTFGSTATDQNRYIFYKGSPSDWTTVENVDGSGVGSSNLYFYEEFSPINDRYWHYIGNNPAVWIDDPTQYLTKSGLKYELNSDNKSYSVSEWLNQSNTDVVITPIIGGLPVTTIKTEAFNQNTQLRSVVIPDSVTTIENSSFHTCSNLRSVLFGKGLTIINEGLFTYCTSLSSITIPGNVSKISNSAFYGCSNLDTVSIEEGVSIIDINVFLGVPGAIYLPSTITSIGGSSISSSADIFYYGNKTDWENIEGVSEISTDNLYYYSEIEPDPTAPENYWHYVDGAVRAW